MQVLCIHRTSVTDQPTIFQSTYVYVEVGPEILCKVFSTGQKRRRKILAIAVLLVREELASSWLK